VLGLPGPDFAAAFRKAWRCALQRRDLSQQGHRDGNVVRFALRRFPFCALSFDNASGVWTSDGWLPEDLERIDPGAIVRRACEMEVHEGATVPTTSESEVGSVASPPDRDAVQEWSRVALAEFLAGVKSRLLLDRLLSSLESPGLMAPDARRTAALQDRSRDQGQEAGTEPARGESAVVWSRVTWDPKTQTLFVTWARSYIARDRLCLDGVVLAGVEVDGKWQDLEARFAKWQEGREGFNFNQVKFTIPPDLLATILAGRLELRISADRELGKDRLVVLFRAESGSDRKD
jgi:hypothetical protein